MRPETQFTRSGDVYLAYQTVGRGDREFLIVNGGLTHVEAMWDIPELSGFVEQLAQVGRVAFFDKRGVGLSDRVTELSTLDISAQDAIAVMDAAGLAQPVLYGPTDGASQCLATAALYPHRVSGIVALEPAPTFVVDKDDPWGFPEDVAQMLQQMVARSWGQGILLAMGAGVVGQDPRVIAAFQRYERMAATPATADWWVRCFLNTDVRPYLAAVKAPVVVVHARGNAKALVSHVQWVADHLPNSRFLELDGDLADVSMPGGPILDELEDLAAGTRVGGAAHRQLVALLVTDLVGSTTSMSRLGEEGWRRLLEDHRRMVRAALTRYAGTEIDTAGDGFLAAFRLASQALRCAVEIRDESAPSGVAVRQGVHAGEVSIFDTGVAGQAVHVAARVAALADAGDVYVTDVALALCTGEHPLAEQVGTRVLRGVPGRWRLHRLASSGAPIAAAAFPEMTGGTP
ncbi:adenylate/guanylate cyclase domain-containing protein [Cellulomonas humilata]|uniref:Adenylate/guanylate cyclase domain-containing protein n=1 Tax=Cellulomonas humilata TaxID=144055 RepID=A0A7Y6A1S1_9CELL|nr:alpha/beta fold hydrolase [Cellulomonas humilata]NUU17295.1 adenylate/guanylate cyclase domain-containing protein [Cellulomonas humilata]